MTQNIWGHSILSSNKWEILYVSVPPVHTLSKVVNSLDVPNAESDGRSQN